MRPILVIGSNSFSGSSFISFLLKQNIEVIGVSRSIEPADVFLPYKWLDEKKRGLFRFLRIDLNNDMAPLISLIKQEGIEVIVNYAAQSMVGESWERPADWMRTNVLTTSVLVERLRHIQTLQKYIHVTTPEVYGSTDGWIDENTHFNPSTPYAVSRAAGDMLTRIYHRTYGLPVISTRAANVFGPGQPLYRIVPKAIFSCLTGHRLKLHGGGLSTRSFIHVDDVSRATWMIARDGMVGDTYHISTNELTSIKDLVTYICNRLGYSFWDCVDMGDERLGKDAAYWLDSTKLRSTLGWIENFTLEQGINQSIEWLTSNLEILKSQPQMYIHKA